jgi:excisionase family DNA binding protein
MPKKPDNYNKLEEQLMTVAEVADFLKISQNTVRSLTTRGELRCYRVGGRKERRFSKADVLAYLEKRSEAKYAHPELRVESIREPTFREPTLSLSSTAVLNRGLHVHDWYLMPESYSEPLIAEAIERFGIGIGDTILDPFSGTGTTVVTAVLKGINGVGLEVNPFLCFASRVKLDWAVDLNAFKASLIYILNEAQPLLESLSVEQNLFTYSVAPDTVKRAQAILSKVDEPDMPRLHKWMSPVVVQKVLILRYLIETYVPEPIRPHFLLALASILRPVSNMKLTPHAFGSNTRREDAPVYDLFAQKITKIYEDLKYLQSLNYKTGKGHILRCDARLAENIHDSLLPASLAVTSPPYLNNLDYTMQTRMELFFLRFVNNMEELRDLRKAMVISDAKAMYKDVRDSEEVKDVQSIQRIATRLREVHHDKNWGWDYAFMTTQYFGGMLRVLRAVKPLLKRHARFILIVGESAHSGIKIPLPEILAELGERAGYKFAEINILRRRRSSSHRYDLCESEVILQKR